MSSKFYLGVDACPSGWIALIIQHNEDWKLELFKEIKHLWRKYHNANLVLIDIPIGLRSHSGKPRGCDSAARNYLTGKRSSCIFPTPCRKALNAPNYDESNKINRQITGKGLSKQTFNIMPKIKEVDTLLTEHNKAIEVVIESQPEVCFTALNNDKPLEFYKKEKQGIKQRLRLLKSHWNFEKTPFNVGKNVYKRSEVSLDDILDAWVLGISARMDLKYIPDNYEHDTKGFPMRMAIPEFGYNN